MSGSFVFMINTEVAIFAQTFGIQVALRMFTSTCFLGSAFGMVTILAHSVRIVSSTGMRALSYQFPMFRLLSLFCGLAFIICGNILFPPDLRTDILFQQFHALVHIVVREMQGIVSGAMSLVLV